MTDTSAGNEVESDVGKGYDHDKNVSHVKSRKVNGISLGCSKEEFSEHIDKYRSELADALRNLRPGQYVAVRLLTRSRDERSFWYIEKQKIERNGSSYSITKREQIDIVNRKQLKKMGLYEKPYRIKIKSHQEP